MTYLFPDSVLMIFCKAPVAGEVKTRLQPALTSEQAADAHRRLVRMTLERTFRQPLCPVMLCCTPNADHAFFHQCAADYSLGLVNQQGNGLGERMHNAFDEALKRYRQAILIGCDCPSMTAGELYEAMETLASSDIDAVISPAEDGGYVLIGLKSDQPVLFSGMPWGTDRVMAETRRRAKIAGLSLRELKLQWDVDTFDDWRRFLDLQSA